MSRQSSDSTATTSRHRTGHGISSAFSSSANPDEDWTKISDLAERRKIQNRIAQRNYRKKLKRRLEDLEKRAESVSPSSSQMPAGLQDQQDQSVQKYKRSPEIIHQQSSPRILQNNLMFGPPLEREGSRMPPLFAYYTYPSYPQQPYRPVSHVGDQYGDCLAVVPSMMHFHEAIKRDTMNPLNMSYPGFPAIDLHVSHGYEDSNPHIPLSHSCKPSTT